MTDQLISLFTEYPILTLFVVIGLGYVLGQISFFGFRFGLAGVLFAGLAVGALSPAIALPEVVPSLGLIIFVYAIGIHSGPVFFSTFRRQGYRLSLLVVAMLVLGAGITVLLAYSLNLRGPRAAGLYCGALTNTPALAATQDILRQKARSEGLDAETVRQLAAEPVVAYTIAYPIGVIGVLLCFQLGRRLLRVEKTPEAEVQEIVVRDFLVSNPAVVGRTVEEVLSYHRNPGLVVSRIRHLGETDIPTSNARLALGDLVAVVGDEVALARALQVFGEASDTHIESDRSILDYRRVFVSSEKAVGKRIGELDLPNRLAATITRLRRYDVDMVPDADMRLELGDRVRVLTRRTNFAAVSAFFGDSVKGTAETDFGSLAIGMVLGVLFGMLPIPLPGGTTVSMGLAGGPLLVALVLGRLGHTGRVTWVIPFGANITLRRIGLLLFLAGVGTRSGYAFVQTMPANGIQLLAAGAVVTFGVALATLFIGYRLLRIPFDSLMGVISGLQTQPACLTFAVAQSRSEVPNVSYASVYPAAMITKIVLAQLMVSWLQM